MAEDLSGHEQDQILQERFDVSEEQLKEYRDAFSLFDQDGNQVISTEELTTVVRSLGYNPSKNEIQKMIKEVDENGNGEVEFDEFVMLMQRKLKNFYTEEIIREAFDTMDVDGDGYITLPRLKQVIQDLGLEISPDEIQEMMDEADVDKNGVVKYEALIELISSNETLNEANRRNGKIRRFKDPSSEHKRDAEKDKIALDMHREYNSMSEGQAYDDSSGHNNGMLVPDVKSLSSQYGRSEYDKFSRQTKPPETKIIKKVPGQKVPITRTRLAYLQRKNKALSLEGLNVLGISNDLVQEMESPRREVGKQRAQEQYIGSINDPNFEHDRKFKAKASGQFKNVSSKILDDKYFTKPQIDKPMKQKKQGRQLLQHKTVVVDIKKELEKSVATENENTKHLSKKELKKTQSQRNLTNISKESKETPRRYQRDETKESARSIVDETKVTKTNKDTDTTVVTKDTDIPTSYVDMKHAKTKERLYYALWRTAFMEAIKKLHNKEDRGRYAKKYLSLRDQQKSKEAVACSPVVQTPTFVPPMPRNSITDQHAGSYADHYRKVHNMKTPQGDSPLPSNTPRQGKPLVSKSRPVLVTKDKINAMAAIYTGRF